MYILIGLEKILGQPEESILLFGNQKDFEKEIKFYRENKFHEKYKIDFYSGPELDLFLKSKNYDILVANYDSVLKSYIDTPKIYNLFHFTILYTEENLEDIDSNILENESTFYIKKERNNEKSILELLYKIENLLLQINLHKEELKFQTLVQNAPNGIIISDSNGYITFANRNINIYSKEELIGMQVTELVDSYYLQLVKKGIEKVISTGESISIELQANVTKTWVNVNIGLLQNSDKDYTIFYIITNMNKIKNINAELKEFSYVVSHDLKSPLESIDSMINYLRSDISNVSKEDIDKSLKNIHNKLLLMTDLIDGILQYSNLDQSEISKEMIDTNFVIKEVISNIDVKKPFTFDIQKNLPKINFNRFRTYQLFQNLISNAIKNNDKQKGSLIISGNQLSNIKYQFFIKDNGIGISQEYKEKIFNLFETGNNKGSSIGTGIGLAIVKKIILLLEGKITVESKLGEETTFIITLPMKYLSFE